MLLELATRADGRGRHELTATAGGHAWTLVLDADALAERDVLVRTIHELRDDFDRSSFWQAGARAWERKVAALDAAYQGVHAWDLGVAVAPLLAHALDRFPGERWVAVTAGRPDLPLFNLRGSLRVGVLRGLVPEDVLRDICAVQAWSGPGCAALAGFASPDHLPRFRGPEIEILIAAPRSEIDLYFEAHGAGAADREALIRECLEVDAERVRAMMVRSEWHAALHAALRGEVDALGVSLREDATRLALLGALARGGPDRLLVLIAHQDDAGLHLADGPLAIPELAAHLFELRRVGSPPHGSVDLGVCGAEHEGNLADCFQAFGVPIVHTHGRVAHLGRVLATWLWALGSLRAGTSPMSLPELLDRGWIRAWSSRHNDLSTTSAP